MTRLCCWWLFGNVVSLYVVATNVVAQPATRLYTVVVAPDQPDWTYRLGEPVRFTISVMQNGNPVKNATVRYEIGPEKMPPTNQASTTSAGGPLTVAGGTLRAPGFLRCTATTLLDGKEYRGMATVGFEPERLTPTVANPADFRAFWDSARAELARIPLDARMTLLPDRCTETVNVYHVNVQNWGNARLYGILCVPKAAGTYPAVLKVPGAGIRPYAGDVALAERGFITFEIGIHGIPVTMDPVVYANLSAGALAGYPAFNLDDRDRYYYKRVYLGCVRANDFLTQLPQCNRQRLAVTGGSQGGALSIVTAALDNRVTCLAAYYPALCDMTGYLNGRAGGWPHLFMGRNLAVNNKPDKIRTVGYYDVVNFARLLTVPGRYSWGFNDEVCPPTSMYAAYNVISAPKSLDLYLDSGHWTYPEQVERMTNWLVAQLR